MNGGDYFLAGFFFACIIWISTLIAIGMTT